VNFEAMPRTRTQYYREFAAAIRGNPLSFIVPRTFIRDFRGIVVYVSEKEGNILRDIWVWELDDQKRVTRLIRAETGRIDYDESTNSLIPRLINARTEERSDQNPEDFGKSPLAPALQIAPPDLLRLDLNQYLGQTVQRSKPDMLTYAQLRDRQTQLAAEKPSDPAQAEAHVRTRMKTSIVLHDKFNLSLAVLSFAMLGVPLGIKVSRRETSANLGVAVAFVLGFYVLTVMVKWLDTRPELRPDLLLWLPNILFIGLAVWLFRRIES
jgi:lipopolysaccharide export system permease protein